MVRHVANFAHHGRRRLRWRVVRGIHSGFGRLVLVSTHHVNWWRGWMACWGWWLLGVPRVELTPLVHLVGRRIVGEAWAGRSAYVRWWGIHHGRWWWMHLVQWRRRLSTAGICMMVSSAAAVHRSVVGWHGRQRMMSQIVVPVGRSNEVPSDSGGGGGRMDRRRLHRWGRWSCPVGHAGVEVETSSIGTVLKRRWLGWHVRIGRVLGMRRRWGWDRC